MIVIFFNTVYIIHHKKLEKREIEMKRYVLFVCLLLSGLARVYAQSIAPFQKGDRIAFVGNSITCGGHYHSYIWLYYMTRFPDQRIDIFNEGVGGDVAEMIYQRLDKVFEHEPTVVTLSFGMNDVGYMDFRKPGADTIARNRVEKACRDYALIEEVYKKYPEVRKILIGSSPYDETSRFNKVAFPGKNTQILKIVDFLNARARENQWGFVDFNRPMVAINQWEQAADSMYTLCGKDRIHPSTDGHLVMAYLFLKAQGLAGKLVADIRIDGAGKKVTRSDNCRVSDLSVSSDNLTFTYEAKSLPYPIDTSYYDNEKHTQADALSVIPFMDEMNYEGLSVSGLSDGYYGLTIGGEFIGRFTARELERGINMALLQNTPQYKQAMKIRQMNEERWLKERKMREFYWVEYNLMRKTGMLWACDEAAVDTLRKYRPHDIFLQWNGDLWLQYMHKGIREDCVNEQQDLVNQIYEQNKPIPLRIEIKKFTDL